MQIEELQRLFGMPTKEYYFVEDRVAYDFAVSCTAILHFLYCAP